MPGFHVLHLAGQQTGSPRIHLPASNIASMCRSIKTLRSEEAATDLEIYEASLQFVRKISGYRVPSKANEETFNRAVAEISDSSRRLLESLVVGRRVAG